MFARKKKPEYDVETVSVEEHDRVKEKYHLALSTIDNNIQAIRESRQKARRIFELSFETNAVKAAK